jgi:hypothetical protein
VLLLNVGDVAGKYSLCANDYATSPFSPVQVVLLLNVGDVAGK